MKPFTVKGFDLWNSSDLIEQVYLLHFVVIDNIVESSVTLLQLIAERDYRTIILSDGIVRSRQEKRLPPSSF